MTNLEWLIREHYASVTDDMSDWCFAEKFSNRDISCDKCKFRPDDSHSCKDNILAWMKQEHIEHFEIGDLVIVESCALGCCSIGFFNGAQGDDYYITICVDNVGKTDELGNPMGVIYKKDRVKRYGDNPDF